MKPNDIYTIRYVANQTGLKPYILRTWEKRYDAISPRRTTSNRRVYSSSDLKRLHLLKTAVDAGHPISRVAPLKTAELAGLVDRNQSSKVSEKDHLDRLTPESEDATVNEALGHVRQLDPLGLEKTLENAAVNLPRQKLLHSVIQPMFERIGELWAAGKLKIIHEHMATVVTRSILLDMLKTEVLTDGAPKLVVATPVGQWHEAGALVAALTAAEAGWRPLYFGPNLPAEEIAAAVKQTRSKAVALSICHRIERALLQRELRKLNRFTGNGIPVLVGGYVVGDIAEVISGARAKCISSVKVFKSELSTLQWAS